MSTTPPQNLITTKKTLLDLPPELRLPIYSHLLIAQIRWKQDPISRQGLWAGAYYSRHQHKSTLAWTSTNIEPADLKIRGPGKNTNPSSMYFCREDTYRADHFGPYIAIIFTCRTIAQEAIPILYLNNRFNFELKAAQNPDALGPTTTNIARLRQKLFRYTSANWNPNPAFRSSEFVAFLNVIGRRNATSIKSLCVEGKDAECITHDMPLIQELVAHHLPNLRHLKIHVALKYIDEDEYDWRYDMYDIRHGDRSSPFWANGRSWPLYEALTGFVKGMESLRTFEYDGHMHFSEFECGWEGWRKLKELEGLVKSRAGRFA